MACEIRLQKQQVQQDVEWNMTHALQPPPRLLLSYEQCLAECGAGMGDVDWGGLSGNFGTWLLPWIALMFQIPFVAEGKIYCPVFACLTVYYSTQTHWTMSSPSG